MVNSESKPQQSEVNASSDVRKQHPSSRERQIDTLSGRDIDTRFLLSLLKRAIAAVPAVKYALGVAGIASAGLIVNLLLGANWVVVVALMLLAMILLFVFSRMVNSRSKAARWAGDVLIWVVVLCFAAIPALTIVYVITGRPERVGPLLGMLQLSKRPETQPLPNGSPPDHAGVITAKDGLQYLWIPAGDFQSGCSATDRECFEDERPSHLVKILHGFWISRTEVTVAAFRKYSESMSAVIPQGQLEPGYPVVNLTWDEAVSYCQWLGGRLPTEVEWEYAARAGSPAARYGELDHIAWYSGNSKSLHPVASKEANLFGLHDMLGNASEWTNDSYDTAPYRDNATPIPATDSLRSIRGGSYLDQALRVRVSARDRREQDARASNLGFRCVLDKFPL